MEKIIFPDEMESFSSSRHPRQLKYIRTVSLFLLLILLLFTTVFELIHPYTIENSVVFITLLFELSVLTAYTTGWLDHTASVWFLIAWSFTSTFTCFMFFTNPKLEPFNFIYLVPWLATLMDFLYNRVTFVRAQYFIPVAVIEFFAVFVLDDLRNVVFSDGTWEQKAFQHCFMVLGVVVLEGSKAVKSCWMERSDIEQKLVE